MPSKRPLAERFMGKFKIVDSGCWIWTAAMYKSGYGSIGLGSRGDGSRRSEYAHRLSWMLFRGSIPQGMVVCHKCDIKACVNPEHLFVASQAGNIADCIKKGRKTAPPIRRGNDNNNASLSKDDILSIRISAGTYRSIAEGYGISLAHVWRIRARKVWRHVLEEATNA